MIDQQKILTFNKYFYFVLLFVLTLESIHAWFFWSVPNRFLFQILIALLTIIVYAIDPRLFSLSRKYILIFIFCYLIARLGAVRGNVNAYLGALIGSVNVLLFVVLNKKYQHEAIVFLSKSWAFLLVISLFFWILFLFKLPLPFFQDSFGYSELRSEALYYYNNYYFFLYNTGTVARDFSDLILPRFSSVILEPGYLGLLMVVLLYINGFKLKYRYNVLYLMVLFFTFSLAGWLFGAYSYLIYALRNNRNRLGVIISVTLFLLVFTWFFSRLNEGHNPVNQLIIERVRFDEDKGTISGYNRTGEDFDFWFQTEFLKSSDVLFGSDDYQRFFANSTNVGWKPYVAQYGYIGLATYLLFLIVVCFMNRNFLTIGFFLLYVAILSRGHHEVFWAVFPILYIGGSSYLNTIESKKRRNKGILTSR